ncbi:adrenocorticotropic hormone receptor [Aplochiton taeniatus]
MINGPLSAVASLTVNQSDCPEVMLPFSLFFTIGVVSLVENLLVVVAVIHNRNLHSPMYCFICSLAAFNTLASLSKTCENLMMVFVDVGHLDSRGYLARKLDDVVDALLCISFVGSFSSFLAIAVDRYITIFHALRYHNIMTMRRAAAILVGIWLVCGTGGGLMAAFSDHAGIQVLFLVLFLVSLALIVFLYVHMFLLARVHARKIAVLPGSGGGPERGGLRGAFTLTILFGVFVFCWAPFFLHLLLMMACPLNPYCECYRSLFQLHVVLLMSHAVVDPAIYAYRSAELRHTFRKMLFCSNYRSYY